jgi:hypothetical protein
MLTVDDYAKIRVAHRDAARRAYARALAWQLRVLSASILPRHLD